MTTLTQMTIEDEVSRFGLAVGIVSAFIVGVWGFVSLISALSSYGVIGLANGYITTLTGV